MKKVISFIMVVLIVFFTVSVPSQAKAASDEWDGETITQPTRIRLIDNIYYFEISTPEELAYIGLADWDWRGYNYILTNDIVLNKTELTYDINGNLTVSEDSLNKWEPFSLSGVFDGNGYSISGVYVNSSEDYSAFFSSVREVKNLTLKNSYIRSSCDYNDGDFDAFVGGLCAKLGGTMSDCYYYGAVVSYGHAGGLCAENAGNINNCGNYGDIWGEYYVGGIAGISKGNITECFNNGQITATEYCCGGILGAYESNINVNNCVNKGFVTGNNYVGGIVGSGSVFSSSYSKIYNCLNFGNITGKTYVGGICARISDFFGLNVSFSVNYGSVVGDSYIGGITGYMEASNLKECYNIGNVIGVTYTGAIIGESKSIWGKGKVSNCYYLKDDSVNTSLNGFGNVEDIDNIVEAKDIGFFCINSDNMINIGGHTEEIIHGKPATCTEKGITDGKKCSVCGEIFVAQETIPATGHTYTTEVIAPTCTEKGYTIYSCFCGFSDRRDYVLAPGHALSEWEVVVEAQVGIKGKEQKKCTVCDTVVDERTIPALPEVTYSPGDINGDGKVNAIDARIILRISAQLDSMENYSLPLAVFDLTGDGKVNALDARKALRIGAQLE